MSKVQTMPLAIWTDINGNAARTQFKGGTKYIRADAQATVEAAISDRNKQQDISKALQQQVEALQAQLPAEMQSCTILFKECEKGHGRLTATNWIDYGCQTCVVEALQRERDALKIGLNALRDAYDELESRHNDTTATLDATAPARWTAEEIEQAKREAKELGKAIGWLDSTTLEEAT